MQQHQQPAHYAQVPEECFLDLPYSITGGRGTHTVLVPSAPLPAGDTKYAWLARLSPSARQRLAVQGFDLVTRTLVKMAVQGESPLAKMLLRTVVDVAPVNLMPRMTRTESLLWYRTPMIRELCSNDKATDLIRPNNNIPESCTIWSVSRDSVSSDRVPRPRASGLPRPVVSVHVLTRRFYESVEVPFSKSEWFSSLSIKEGCAIRARGFEVLVRNLEAFVSEGQAEAVFVLDTVADILDDGRDFEWTGWKYAAKLDAMPAYQAALEASASTAAMAPPSSKRFKPIIRPDADPDVQRFNAIRPEDSEVDGGIVA